MINQNKSTPFSPRIRAETSFLWKDKTKSRPKVLLNTPTDLWSDQKKLCQDCRPTNPAGQLLARSKYLSENIKPGINAHQSEETNRSIEQPSNNTKDTDANVSNEIPLKNEIIAPLRAEIGISESIFKDEYVTADPSLEVQNETSEYPLIFSKSSILTSNREDREIFTPRWKVLSNLLRHNKGKSKETAVPPPNEQQRTTRIVEWFKKRIHINESFKKKFGKVSDNWKYAEKRAGIKLVHQETVNKNTETDKKIFKTQCHRRSLSNPDVLSTSVNTTDVSTLARGHLDSTDRTNEEKPATAIKLATEKERNFGVQKKPDSSMKLSKVFHVSDGELKEPKVETSYEYIKQKLINETLTNLQDRGKSDPTTKKLIVDICTKFIDDWKVTQNAFILESITLMPIVEWMLASITNFLSPSQRKSKRRLGKLTIRRPNVVAVASDLKLSGAEKKHPITFSTIISKRIVGVMNKKNKKHWVNWLNLSNMTVESLKKERNKESRIYRFFSFLGIVKKKGKLGERYVGNSSSFYNSLENIVHYKKHSNVTSDGFLPKIDTPDLISHGNIKILWRGFVENVMTAHLTHEHLLLYNSNPQYEENTLMGIRTSTICEVKSVERWNTLINKRDFRTSFSITYMLLPEGKSSSQKKALSVSNQNQFINLKGHLFIPTYPNLEIRGDVSISFGKEMKKARTFYECLYCGFYTSNHIINSVRSIKFCRVYSKGPAIIKLYLKASKEETKEVWMNRLSTLIKQNEVARMGHWLSPKLSGRSIYRKNIV